MDKRWQAILDTARAVHAASPELQAFCPFPDPVGPQNVDIHIDPLCEVMRADDSLESPKHAAFCEALMAAAPLAQWRETYRDTPIGDVLHAHFGTFAILGLDAPFATDEMRGFLVYQRPGYHYPMHHHPAEEMYFVLAGEAEFHVDGEGSRILRPGDTQFHETNQPHALTTHNRSVLAYVLWRGDLLTKPVFTYPDALISEGEQ